MIDWEDFYEPSEYEQMVDEFKDSLRRSVKDEILNEIKKFRDECERLREIRDNWDSKVRELEAGVIQKKVELTKAIEKAKDEGRNAKQMRLRELLADHQAFVYTIHTEKIRQPKCNLCDENRYRHYITPLGREAKEECFCKAYKTRYHVKRAPLVEIRQFRSGKILSAYLFDPGWEEESMRNATEFFDETPFEQISTYKALFRDENRARRYAAWKNKQEEAKENAKND